MMAADSLRFVVPSGPSFARASPCRRTCSADALAPHLAPPPARRSHVQRLALNAAGLWPWQRSPAKPLRGVHRRGAAGVHRERAGQRWKARYKVAARWLAKRQSARGGDAARARG